MDPEIAMDIASRCEIILRLVQKCTEKNCWIKNHSMRISKTVSLFFFDTKINIGDIFRISDGNLNNGGKF